MKPWRSLIDWSRFEGAIMAVFLGALLLLPFAATLYSDELLVPVSYTHLTLPTKWSV